MRILVIASTFPRWQGDTEPAFVFELCRRLQKSGITIDVIAPHATGAKTLEVMNGINVYRYRYCPERLEVLAYQGGILANLRRHGSAFLLVPGFFLFQGLAVWRRLRKEKYDLMHAHWLIPQGLVCVLVNLLRARGNRIPVVCTSHGGDLYALRGRPFPAIKNFVMKRLAHLCVVSRAMQATCIGYGMEPEKINVLPMGVDLRNIFRPAANTVRHAHRLLFVGRLVEKKGVTHALDAMAILKKTIPGIELLVVGDGPELPALKQKITQLGLEDQNVTLAGSIRNVELPAIYSSAAVFVMPAVVDSHGDQEGFGLVLVEAMGCGCAVVASDLPPIHDIVQHGQNGLLTKPGDARDLADKILQLLQDRELCLRLAANGRESVRGRFDWETTATQYQKLFVELLAHTNV
ncbi:MAG: glycosyltransferase [Gammaproteobacteria bacterium]